MANNENSTFPRGNPIRKKRKEQTKGKVEKKKKKTFPRGELVFTPTI